MFRCVTEEGEGMKNIKIGFTLQENNLFSVAISLKAVRFCT